MAPLSRSPPPSVEKPSGPRSLLLFWCKLSVRCSLVIVTEPSLRDRGPLEVHNARLRAGVRLDGGRG